MSEKVRYVYTYTSGCPCCHAGKDRVSRGETIQHDDGDLTLIYMCHDCYAEWQNDLEYGATAITVESESEEAGSTSNTEPTK